ncbi:MAG: hypothetical protein JWO78_2102 [Micavibrio sp.]|nr:hypothetical protein [Micavibrio sp.]
MTFERNLPESIMPESTDRALCFLVNGLLTTDKYEIAGTLFDEMLSRQGEIRLLILYKKFEGWEEAATKMDMGFGLKYGSHLTRMALVNPPAMMISQLKLRKAERDKCEVRYFNADDFQTALAWVNE